MSKVKVAVIFGGRSGEHEVSLVSATSVIKALDPERYEVMQIGITLEGLWYTGEGCLEKFKKGDYEGLEKMMLSSDVNDKGRPDIVFPVLHGPFGEDGTIQGLLEMLQLPYVGCGVMASSVAMDKLQCKRIWQAAGLPVVEWVDFLRSEWEAKQSDILRQVEREIGFPCFVKPVNMGSSVGITKVKKSEDLVEAIDLAAKFDSKIMVEKGLEVREIECAVLGNEAPIAGPLGEVIVGGEFYDFNDKYVNGVSSTEIPAKIESDLAAKITKNSIMAYKLLDCSGLSRVDTFVDKNSGKIYLNEINTMPGFTSISMYPKMMAAYGLSYPELVDRLIELGVERFKERQRNQVAFDSESDWFQE